MFKERLHEGFNRDSKINFASVAGCYTTGNEPYGYKLLPCQLCNLAGLLLCHSEPTCLVWGNQVLALIPALLRGHGSMCSFCGCWATAASLRPGGTWRASPSTPSSWLPRMASRRMSSSSGSPRLVSSHLLHAIALNLIGYLISERRTMPKFSALRRDI